MRYIKIKQEYKYIVRYSSSDHSFQTRKCLHIVTTSHITHISEILYRVCYFLQYANLFTLAVNVQYASFFSRGKYVNCSRISIYLNEHVRFYCGKSYIPSVFRKIKWIFHKHQQEKYHKHWELVNLVTRDKLAQSKTFFKFFFKFHRFLRNILIYDKHLYINRDYQNYVKFLIKNSYFC